MIAMPAGSEWRVLVSGAETAGRVAVVETRIAAGQEPPRHMHSHEDELVIVLEGHVQFQRDGAHVDGPAGACLFLPRGSDHSFTIESAAARLLIVLLPAGLENALQELARLGDRAREPYAVELLVTTAARFGVAITGPR
jgi:quercetin dioxygenase-like cupin family protein